MLAYRLLQLFLRIVVSVFFRNIEIIGKEKIPESGGLIFAGNHPNSLMDPVLVITHSGKKVHFAAKDLLFKSRFLRFFLNALGAVPIKRRQDHGSQTDNSSAFEALFRVLQQGGSMGIFPEGISHMSSELASLKTGTARIALNAASEEHDQPHPLFIVPVGLTYLHRQRFRSQVLLHFGDPIPIDEEWCTAYKNEPKETVQKLTQELDSNLRALTVNAPDWDTLRLLHTARRLYKPKRVRLDLETYSELMRRFSEGYQKARNQPEVQMLREQLEGYQERLSQLGIQDHDLRRDVGWFRLTWRFFRRMFYLLILIPLSLPGMLIHAPIGISAVIAGDYLTARKDVVATTKIISAILLVPLLYLVTVIAVFWWQGSTIALLVAGLLPLSGYATIRVLERQFAVGRSLKAMTQLLRYRQEILVLRELREQLTHALETAVQQFRDPNKPRIFPRAGGLY